MTKDAQPNAGAVPNVPVLAGVEKADDARPHSPDIAAMPGARELVLQSVPKNSRAHMAVEWERVDELRGRVASLETALADSQEALHRRSERLYIGPYLATARVCLTVCLSITVSLAKGSGDPLPWILVIATAVAYVALEVAGVWAATRRLETKDQRPKLPPNTR